MMSQSHFNICSYNARFYFFRNWEPIYFSEMIHSYVRARGLIQTKMRKLVLFCHGLSFQIFIAYGKPMCYRNQNGVELQKLLTLQRNVFNLGVKYLFSLRKKFYFCIDDFQNFHCHRFST